MTYSEDDLLPISGLQHLAFCPRQCALIHLERLWSENFLTASGRTMHERVHNAPSESRGALRTARGVALRSLRLGLFGIADVVEFRRVDDSPDVASEPDPFDPTFEKTTENASPKSAVKTTSPETPSSSQKSEFVRLPKRRGFWRPYPVEYKRGAPKTGNCDAVQLCAQAICLEETLDCFIPEGSLFYGQTKRRVVVSLDADLRAETERLAREFHKLVDAQIVPPPTFEKRCKSCSLADECLPNLKKTATQYLRQNWEDAGAFQ